MDWLNYHHLYYFWRVARAGSISAASRELLLSPPTISAQIQELERSLGEPLFNRVGRRLTLTESGRMAYRYADEIFTLGREFVDAMQGKAQSTSLEVAVGVNDVLPKSIVYRLIEPLFRLTQPVRVKCIQGTPIQLLPPLAVHELDLVLSDAPPSPDIRVRAFSHLLGESGVSFFASPKIARQLRRHFPGSLDGAPALLPVTGSALRVALDNWFEAAGVRPKVVAHFEDVALLSACGEHGLGFFAGYNVVEPDMIRVHGVEKIGDMTDYAAQFYAISVERRLTHPAVVAITKSARSALFARQS